MSTRATFWVFLVLICLCRIELASSVPRGDDDQEDVQIAIEPIVSVDTSIVCEYRKQCLGNTVSKLSDLEPDAFWPISAAYHATDISQTNNNTVLIAIGASIVQGPNFYDHETDSFESMVFTGGLSSYAEIPNTDDSLNGNEMFSWALYIRPRSIDLARDRYIMAYYGSNGQDGLQLLQRGHDIVLQIFDRDGNYKGENVHTNAFASDGRIFLLISFNGLSSPAQIETNVITPLSGENYQAFPLGELNLVNAVGNIRFGRSFDDNKASFRGRLSCILKFTTFVFGPVAKEAHKLCDPAVYTDPSVSIYWSMSAPSQPPPKVTTESVETTTSDTRAATAALDPPTTTPEPEPPTTNHVTTATDQSSGEGRLTTRSSTETQRKGYPDNIPLNTCIRHHLYREGFVLASAMLSQPVNAVQDCSRLCRRTSHCVSFSVTGQSTDTQLTCSLGSERPPQDLTPYTGARIFTLV